MDPSTRTATPAEVIGDGVEQVVTDPPDGDAGEIVRLAVDGAEGAFAPNLLREVADGQSDRIDDAAATMTLLEAAALAEVGVHRIASTLADEVHNDRGRDRAATLAGSWLRTRAAERAAELGDEALARFSATLLQAAQGWMLDATDLYDAARSPEQYYAAAEGTRGSLGSLAAALGGLVSGASEQAVRALAVFGAKLAVAAKVADDIILLQSGSEASADVQRTPLSNGVYTLPVILAVDARPELRKSLGGSIQVDRLRGLVEEITATDAPARAAYECRRLVQEAIAAIEALASLDRLIPYANQVADRAEGPVTG